MNILTSWRTSILGLTLAIGNVVIPLFQGGSPTWKQIAASALIAAFGFVAKDANVTGGTTLAAGAVPDAMLHQAKAIETVNAITKG